MGFEDMTNYSQEKMYSLSGTIGGYKKEYENLVAQLESRINEMHNYWLDDSDAEVVYQKLFEQFNKFKTSMQEGYDTMTQFEQQVLTQIDNYEEAEQKTSNMINV